jgi:hypothetical protein
MVLTIASLMPLAPLGITLVVAVMPPPIHHQSP